MSILDQGMLSIINFAINIHLSRILVPGQYGIFAIVFSVYLLLLNFNQALILEPLNIVGMTRYKDNLISYFKKITWIQFSMSIILSLLLLLFAFYFSYVGNQIYRPLISMALAGPFVCTFFLTRRFCYLLYNPSISLVGSVIYAITLSLGYYLLLINDAVDSFNIFLLFGGASIVSSVLIIAVLNFRYPSLKSLVNTKMVLYKHWNLGKWVLGSTVIGWLSTSVYFPLTGALIGLEASASLKAIDNLLLPMHQIITSISLLIIPKIAGKQNKNAAYLRAIFKRLTLVFTTFAVIYLALLQILGKDLVKFLYGTESGYVNYLWLTPFVGIPLLARTIVDIGMGVPLRIVEKFDVLFKSSAANSLFTVSLGLIFVWKYALPGAGLALAIGSVVQICIAGFYFRKVFSNKQS